jgi:hypothetical protein
MQVDFLFLLCYLYLYIAVPFLLGYFNVRFSIFVGFLKCENILFLVIVICRLLCLFVYSCSISVGIL